MFFLHITYEKSIFLSSLDQELEEDLQNELPEEQENKENELQMNRKVKMKVIFLWEFCRYRRYYFFLVLSHENEDMFSKRQKLFFKIS